MANEIVVKEVNPLAILQQAVDKGVDTEQLTALMGLAERWEVNQDKKRFREAMATFSKTLPKIEKNQHVRFTTAKGVTEYDHATLDNVTEQIVAGISAVGVTHSFRITQVPGLITITCILSYGVYSEETSLSAAPDDSGGKNSIQAVVSTTTYLRRHTLLAITGTATGMDDDDGNGLQQTATENVVSDITTAKTMPELQQYFSTAYMMAAKRPDDQKKFKDAYDKRKAELAGAKKGGE